MQTVCLINGRPGDNVAAEDRGLQYGDGLFETLATFEGTCEFWDRHMRRLREGCARLQIPAPAPASLAAEAQELCRAAPSRAVLKIIVTRGLSGRGYRPSAATEPTRILRLGNWPDFPAKNEAQGVSVRLCSTRLGSQPALAGIKHLNRLEQVLARMEWDDPAIAEGLLTDSAGHIIEGTSTNIFLVKGDKIFTPRLDTCGVAGVMRDVIMDVAAQNGLVCVETPVSKDELFGADEIFLTNSLIGIWPVRACGAWQVAAPGPVTRILQEGLRQLRQTARS